MVGTLALTSWLARCGSQGSSLASVRLTGSTSMGLLRALACAHAECTIMSPRSPTQSTIDLRPVDLPPPVLMEAPDSGGQMSPATLERVKMRLDGLGTYAVVSALVVNMGIRLVSSTTDEVMTKVWWPLSCAYCAALVACVLSGVYATVVFTLTKMYSKTAIGLYRDAAFTEFFRATAQYRVSGFLAFCTSLGSFAFAFVTFFLLRVRGAPGLVGFLVGLAFVWKGINDILGIYRRAGKLFIA